MLIAYVIAICSTLLASASVKKAEHASDPDIDSVIDDSSATFVISNTLRAQLSSDPAFHKFYHGLGYFSENIPEEDRAIYSELGRAACSVIVYDIPIPEDIDFGLPGACSLACLNDSGFLMVSKGQNPRYSIVFFYQNSTLRVVFLIGKDIIAGGMAKCNSRGFFITTARTYENGRSINVHPKLDQVLSFIQEKYNLDPITIRDVMILAQFGFQHQQYSAFVKKISNDDGRKITFSKLPFSIGLENDQIVVRDKKSDKVLYGGDSLKKMIKENEILVRFDELLFEKIMALLSELQNYCQTIETPTLPNRPALEINSDADCYSRRSKTKSAYNFKTANHKVAPTDG